MNLESEARRERQRSRKEAARRREGMRRLWGETESMRPRTGREVRLVRRRLRPDILAEVVRWAGPDLVTVRWERRGENRRRGWPEITWHTRVLKTTSSTRLDSSKLGSRQAK